MNLRRLVAIGSGIAATLMLSACAQSATPAAPQETAREQSLTALQYFQSKQTWNCEAGKEHWRSSGTPKRGGAFVILGSSSGLGTEHLDTSAPGGGHSGIQVYEHLVDTRACYYEDTVMVPNLAKSWQVSADGLTWTLKLNEKARWHNVPPVNGRPFTSADVAWMIDHQKKEGQLRSTWNPITHEEPDQQTIVLKLKDPDPDFLGNVLGERLNVMMPREVKEQYGDFKTVAIGTGPYMVEEFVPNLRRTWKRNPDYFGMGVDGKPLPYIDRVEFPTLADLAAEIAAIRTGQLDLNGILSVGKRDFDALVKANPKLRTYRDIAPIPRGLWMNLNVKPFDDVNVRKAIFYATDHDEIVELAYSGGGVRSGHLPSAIAQFAWPVDKVQELFKPDLEKAKEYLVKAGYGPNNPLTIRLTVGNVAADAGGEVAQAQLKKVGITVNIESWQGAAAGAVSQRKYDTAWSGVSPASIFADRWMGGFIRCGDSRNYTGICDPEVDRLSLAQGKELDVAKRKVILDQLQQRLYDLMPWVPTFSLVYYRIYSCRVQNMPSSDYQQQLTGLASAWIDDTGC